MYSAEETACVLAVMFKRSKQTRARVSCKTLKFVARRKNLRLAFVSAVKEALAEYSLVLCEREHGGYAILKASSLDSPKPILAKNWLTMEERNGIRKEKSDFSAFENELLDDDPSDVDDESDDK